MRVLFDVNTPAPLRRFLRAHEVTCAQDLDWQGLENGDLLNAAEGAGFEVLVTCDQNIRYQQNLADRKLAVVVLSTNHWAKLRLVTGKIERAIDFAQRGQLTRLDVRNL